MAHRQTDAGFVLIDSLVALLLLAVVLLAAIAALLRGMHSAHQAVLTGRAVDLAADLLEARRALPEQANPQPLLDAWHARVDAELPQGPRDTALALVQPLIPAGAEGSQ